MSVGYSERQTNFAVYDMIRYGRLTCAQKLTRWPAYNLAHGPETKKLGKNKIKNLVAQKKRFRQESVKAVREEEVKLRGSRIYTLLCRTVVLTLFYHTFMSY